MVTCASACVSVQLCTLCLPLHIGAASNTSALFFLNKKQSTCCSSVLTHSLSVIKVAAGFHSSLFLFFLLLFISMTKISFFGGVGRACGSNGVRGRGL